MQTKQLGPILHPAMTHRFLALFFYGSNNEMCESIVKQLEQIKYDLKLKSGSARLRIPQCGDGIFTELDMLCKHGRFITIQNRSGDGNDEYTSTLRLNDLKIESCIMDHDYAKQEILRCNITFSFGSMSSTDVKSG